MIKFFVLLLFTYPVANISAEFVEYQYTGGEFDYFHPEFPDTDPAVTNLNFVFTTPTALAPNVQYFLSNASSYAFNDGYTFFTDSDAQWGPIQGWVKMDAAGNIFNWSARVEHYSPWAVDEARMFYTYRIANPYEEYEDFVVYCHESTGYACQGGKALSRSNTSTWSSATIVPIPASLFLYLAGLFTIFGMKPLHNSRLSK